MATNDRYALQKAAWLLARSLKDFVNAANKELVKQKPLDKWMETWGGALHDARIALNYVSRHVPYLDAKSEAEFRAAHEKEMEGK